MAPPSVVWQRPDLKSGAQIRWQSLFAGVHATSLSVPRLPYWIDSRYYPTGPMANQASSTEMLVILVAPPVVNSARYGWCIAHGLVCWDRRPTTQYHQRFWPLWWHHLDAFPQMNNRLSHLYLSCRPGSDKHQHVICLIRLGFELPTCRMGSFRSNRFGHYVR